MCMSRKGMIFILLTITYFTIETEAKTVRLDKREIWSKRLGSNNKYLIDAFSGNDDEYKQFLYLLHNLSVPLESLNLTNVVDKNQTEVVRVKKSPEETTAAGSDTTVADQSESVTGGRRFETETPVTGGANIEISEEPLEVGLKTVPSPKTALDLVELTRLPGPGEATEAGYNIVRDEAIVSAVPENMEKGAKDDASSIIASMFLVTAGVFTLIC